MDPVLAVVIGLVVVVGAAGAWWLLRRRTPAPAEDEWELPPEETASPQPLGPQLLDRNALLHRNRVLDPTKWDNTPDGPDSSTAAADEPDDLPRVLDRDYLERRQRPQPSDD